MNDLFAELERANAAARREEMLRCSWEAWGWDGPSVGGLCDIDAVIANTVDGSPLYCYMEQARLIEQREDGVWVAEIAMPGDWYKNGCRVLLERQRIGPPRRAIREAKASAQSPTPPDPGHEQEGGNGG